MSVQTLIRESTLNTPPLNSTNENTLPYILSLHDGTEFDHGFSDNCLESAAEKENISDVNTNIGDPISTREIITSKWAKQKNDVPEPKRPRMSNEEQLSNTKLLHSIENLVENSVKQMLKIV